MREPRGPLNAELVLAAVELMGRAGRDGTVRVQGQSMLPTLRPGQLLAVEFAPRALARGDLLLFRQGGLLLVHRSLGRARPSAGRILLRTRGDGAPTLDPPVDPAHVVGRVIAVAQGPCWRSFRGPAGRTYGWCVAWHALFWAAVGLLLQHIEAGARRANLRLDLRWRASRIDRLLLRAVHALLFDLAHPRGPKPEVVGG